MNIAILLPQLQCSNNRLSSMCWLSVERFLIVFIQNNHNMLISSEYRLPRVKLEKKNIFNDMIFVTV
ncbi:unnamed protein product [Rotaria magnacalcarata]